MSHETWKDIMRSYAKADGISEHGLAFWFCETRVRRKSPWCVWRALLKVHELGFVLVTAQADCQAHLQLVTPCGSVAFRARRLQMSTFFSEEAGAEHMSEET